MAGMNSATSFHNVTLATIRSPCPYRPTYSLLAIMATTTCRMHVMREAPITPHAVWGRQPRRAARYVMCEAPITPHAVWGGANVPSKSVPKVRAIHTFY